MKNLIWILGTAILITSSVYTNAASAELKETTLLERTYKLRVQAGTFTCRDGIPPNGHNFPVNTMLRFTLANFNLWSGDVWTNVSQYRGDVGYEPCKNFPNLLRPVPEQDLIGVVTQKITESQRLNGFGTCMRVTREEATMVVDGVHFEAVEDFIVGPVDAALCK